MAKNKPKEELIVPHQKTAMPIFTGINQEYKPIPRFHSGCKNC